MKTIGTVFFFIFTEKKGTKMKKRNKGGGRGWERRLRPEKRECFVGLEPSGIKFTSNHLADESRTHSLIHWPPTWERWEGRWSLQQARLFVTLWFLSPSNGRCSPFHSLLAPYFFRFLSSSWPQSQFVVCFLLVFQAFLCTSVRLSFYFR